MIMWMCCTQYASKFGKLSSGHSIGKCQLSFQSQRKAMSKISQTTVQLHSSHTQRSPSQASTIHEPWTSRCSSWFLKRHRNQRSNCQHPLDNRKSKSVPEKYLFLLYWLCRSLWAYGSQQTVENFSRIVNTRPPDLNLEKFVLITVCSSWSNC